MLEQNIYDMIEEQQLKLGYLEETVRLYYPLSSLNRFFDAQYSEEEMKVRMLQFAEDVKNRYGKIRISNQGERFCVAIPPEGARYVHERSDKECFLAKLITAIRKTESSLEDVLDVFRMYSDCVHVEKTTHGEFDYLVYFENGIPDSYRYCISQEGCHIIYHRYTKADYEEFGF